MHYYPLLSLAIFVPIFTGILLLSISYKISNTRILQLLSLFGSTISFFITIILVINFNKNNLHLQFVEKILWIKYFNISYYLGINGISILFIVLTAFITFITIIATWNFTTSIKNNIVLGQYLSSFLILSGLIIGTFSAADGMLFYIFFESTLIPMYLIIGIWGCSDRKIYAAFKFFLYTLAGSLAMLIAIIYLYSISGTFEVAVWETSKIKIFPQILIFLAFFIAFAVKIPMWPFHTWLPDVHVEAPTGGSILLAAIMLKLGSYGFLRFSLPIVPNASHIFAPFMMILSLIAIIYISLIALVQTDIKKIIAYSSVAHMGFVTLGIFTFNQIGIEGAIIQMISHGLVSSAMFIIIGILYERIHTRDIHKFGGIANTMPNFATFALIITMASCSLPGTSSFVGEFMIILATMQINFWVSMLSATSLFLGAAYMLWMYKRIYFGTCLNKQIACLDDLNYREIFIFIIFIVLILAIGFYPYVLTNLIHKSIVKLLLQISQMKT